jgi:hypothetical protein
LIFRELFWGGERGTHVFLNCTDHDLGFFIRVAGEYSLSEDVWVYRIYLLDDRHIVLIGVGVF